MIPPIVRKIIAVSKIKSKPVIAAVIWPLAFSRFSGFPPEVATPNPPMIMNNTEINIPKPVPKLRNH